jgi:hypothetical protein
MMKTVPPNWISSSLLNKRKLAEPPTLLELTCSAAADGKGMHSTKEVSMPRIVDASESASRASQYLPSWKRAGRHQAIVDFVSAGSRFKLYMPKENTKVTFVLAGVRAPRTARNATEKPEPYGAEAYKFASKYLQRDVEIGESSSFAVTDISIRFYRQARWIHWSNVPRWNQCSCRARSRGFGKCSLILCRWPPIWSRARQCRGGS